MKRFLLFAGYKRYADGGANDLVGDFKTPEDARAGLDKWREVGLGSRYIGLTWSHIYDSLTMEITENSKHRTNG